MERLILINDGHARSVGISGTDLQLQVGVENAHIVFTLFVKTNVTEICQYSNF
jgi:hypothetical protein